MDLWRYAPAFIYSGIHTVVRTLTEPIAWNSLTSDMIYQPLNEITSISDWHRLNIFKSVLLICSWPSGG